MMITGHIYSLESGAYLARIVNGEILADDRENRKVGTICEGNVYGLGGELLGHLSGDGVGSEQGASSAAFMRLFPKH